MPIPDAEAPPLAELIAAIDEAPDKLHAESTPAAEALIDQGVDALPAVIPLLASSDADTQMRAAYVLEMVTMELFGFRPGQGWEDFAHEIRWRDFWTAMMVGSPDEAGEPDAVSMVAHWQSWLDHRLRSEAPRAP